MDNKNNELETVLKIIDNHYQFWQHLYDKEVSSERRPELEFKYQDCALAILQLKEDIVRGLI